MAQVIIRNLDDGVVERLKRQAEREKASLEQRLRDIVTAAAGPDEDRFRRVSERIGEKLRGVTLNPTDLIREDRDR